LRGKEKGGDQIGNFKLQLIQFFSSTGGGDRYHLKTTYRPFMLVTFLIRFGKERGKRKNNCLSFLHLISFMREAKERGGSIKPSNFSVRRSPQTQRGGRKKKENVGYN